MDCRGHKKREMIVQHYSVTPIAHIKLINGNKIISDAGGDISDSYFIFTCKSKFNGMEEIIYCGKPTAQDFCNMTNQELPELFNPLKSSEKAEHKQIHSNYQKLNKSKKWNETRSQLYNATMLLIAIFDAKPNTPLFSIKSELETYVTYEPYFSRIKAINTIIHKSKKTLRDILNDLGQKNNMKEYSFDLLVSKLREKNIQQYFENE